MSTLGKIVYLSEAQASELFANGSITVDGSTITYSADDLYLTPENIEYVQKSGDTMTGNLRIAGQNWPSYELSRNDGSLLGVLYADASDNKVALRSWNTAGTYYNDFRLPDTQTITENATYNIVTTKGNYTMTGGLNMTVARIYNASYPTLAFRKSENDSNIASIGVGANDNTLAFIEKSPDTSHYENYYLPNPASGLTSDKYYKIVTTNGSYTMSGRLYAPGYTTTATNGYPNVYFQNSGAVTGFVANEASTRRFMFNEYPSDSSTYYESFMIPAPNTGLTANRFYTILTTKDHPTYTVQTLDWSSNNYVSTNYDVWVEKALDTVRFQGLFTLTNLTANTSVSIGTLPVGYRPNNRTERTIGIDMNANWNSPQQIGGQFILVSVYSNGMVYINPGSNTTTNSFWIDMTWCIA